MPLVEALEPKETSEDAGHLHQIQLYRNADRLTGITDIVDGHFHVLDTEWVEGMGMVATTPAADHTHVVLW